MSQIESIRQAEDHFIQVPWCSAILQQPSTVTFAPSSRCHEETPLGGLPTQDQLFRTSLRTRGTIPECIGLYKQPPNETLQLEGLQSKDVQISRPGHQLQISSSSLMFDLQPGVNGYNGSAHGGLIAALMDETMGNFLLLNSGLQHQEKAKRPLSPNILDLDNVGGFFTAAMNVKLKRPIPTPQIVIVTAFLRAIDGRKMEFYVDVKGENDVEYANCEGLWISLPPRKI